MQENSLFKNRKDLSYGNYLLFPQTMLPYLNKIQGKVYSEYWKNAITQNAEWAILKVPNVIWNSVTS